jgi:rRNA maturation endonuclease Nob1
MRCIQCGAELRPNARFCNVCGADQSQALAQAASQAEGQPTVIEPVPVSSAPVAQTGSEGDEVERAKRPPRVLRASDDEPELPSASAPTVTQPVEAAISPTNGAAALDTSAASAAMVGDLPWPLPAQAVVAGRYQVQSVVSAAEAQDGENIYRVTDLRGNEKCWSCGTTYAASDEPQRFCPECGAPLA